MKLKREVEAELHAFLTLILPVHKMKSPGWNATEWKTLLSILKKMSYLTVLLVSKWLCQF
jgi:hypothetical protein